VAGIEQGTCQQPYQKQYMGNISLFDKAEYTFCRENAANTHWQRVEYIEYHRVQYFEKQNYKLFVRIGYISLIFSFFLDFLTFFANVRVGFVEMQCHISSIGLYLHCLRGLYGYVDDTKWIHTPLIIPKNVKLYHKKLFNYLIQNYKQL